MMDWLRQMIGLPEGLHGVIQDSASSATLCALLSARERAAGWRGNQSGLGAGQPRLTVYASEEAHSSVDKGVMIAGLGRDALRKIPTDADFALRPEALTRTFAVSPAYLRSREGERVIDYRDWGPFFLCRAWRTGE